MSHGGGRWGVKCRTIFGTFLNTLLSNDVLSPSLSVKVYAILYIHKLNHISTLR